MRLVDALRAFWNTLLHGKQNCLSGKSEHLVLMRAFQERGRLIDFLQENIDEASDVDLGACVRKIHSDCRKVLQEYVQVEPILASDEGAPYTVQPGYVANLVSVTGHVKGEPPYKAKVIHRGWKAVRMNLPDSLLKSQTGAVLMTAEVEVSK